MDLSRDKNREGYIEDQIKTENENRAGQNCSVFAYLEQTFRPNPLYFGHKSCIISDVFVKETGMCQHSSEGGNYGDKENDSTYLSHL